MAFGVEGFVVLLSRWARGSLGRGGQVSQDSDKIQTVFFYFHPRTTETTQHEANPADPQEDINHPHDTCLTGWKHAPPPIVCTRIMRPFPLLSTLLTIITSPAHALPPEWTPLSPGSSSPPNVLAKRDGRDHFRSLIFLMSGTNCTGATRMREMKWGAGSCEEVKKDESKVGVAWTRGDNGL